jgi:hypothetical protein
VRSVELPDIRAALAACRTDESILDVAQSNIVGPLVGVLLDPVAALEVTARLARGERPSRAVGRT